MPKTETTALTQPLFIVGSTGSGKSAIGLALAERCGGEIVNADAFQLYRGMDILTAKPTGEELQRVPHHLYGILDVSAESDAASYGEMARACIVEIGERGSLPIVVGGSGLYVKALTHGMSPLPRASAALRESLRELSLQQQVAWLRRLDPAGADAMDLQNPRYVERALEISMLSGRPASELKRAWANQNPDFRGVLLHWEREELYARINARTHSMEQAGLVDEVAGLGELSDTAEKAIGIREIRAHLAGICPLDEALASVQQATRRYAKRQATWFRREKGFQSVCLQGDADAKSTADRILALYPDLRR